MKIKIRSRLDIIVREKKIRTATNFAKEMTLLGYKLSTSQAARYLNDDPPPAMTAAFIESACNLFQCLPSDLFHITIELLPEELIDPLLSIPQHAKQLVIKASPAKINNPAPAETKKRKLPWEEEYGVAGPTVKPFPSTKSTK
ncbi:MAG: helix-turn-helix domain-containing protein [Nitrosomonas sp.]|nr:helix-turn-helix domain-containing protein [Nitrosomonas sp.]